MSRSKSFILVVGIAMLAFAAWPTQSNAGESVHIGITLPLPPPLIFPAPPPVILIPGTYVYFVPDIDADIFFYSGYWYRPYKGHWYRAHRYDEKWVLIAPALVPPVLLGLPPDHRARFHDRWRIPYEQLHRNWGWWEKDRYWDRHEDRRDREWRDRDRGPGRERDRERHDRRDGPGGYGPGPGGHMGPGGNGYGPGSGGHMGPGMGMGR